MNANHATHMRYSHILVIFKFYRIPLYPLKKIQEDNGVYEY